MRILLNVRWVLVVICFMLQAGCSDMSSQEQHQVINTGEASGTNYYQQQGQDVATTLSEELGSAFGNMH